MALVRNPDHWPSEEGAWRLYQQVSHPHGHGSSVNNASVSKLDKNIWGTKLSQKPKEENHGLWKGEKRKVYTKGKYGREFEDLCLSEQWSQEIET